MPEDVPLSSFTKLEDESSTTERSVDDGGESVSDRPSEETVTATPDIQAVSTYGWGEFNCNDCGESTARVWRETDRLVCPSCKQW